ncbi:hypothetical protein DW068_12940 [Anaerobutyricum hallii]|uniref:Uncharacterized protein n=1 Tax=Anaerobutyricum hallii TaxID=39488 RepID=A0A415G4V2_9FIRM|nr:hypothetical protein DW068_12940 [Anaerobutyricum hallii]
MFSPFYFNPQPVSFMQRLNADAFPGSASLHVSGGYRFFRSPLMLHVSYNSSHSLKKQGRFLAFYKK